MERFNYVKQVQDEKRATKVRLEQLRADLQDAEAALVAAKGRFDQALFEGKDDGKPLKAVIEAQTRIEALGRVISDIEGRILPGFSEREKEAREAARKAASAEIKPIHEATKAEIEGLLAQIDEKIFQFMQEVEKINSAWGSTGIEHLERFVVKKPAGLRSRLSFENELLAEQYRPSAAYQPTLGGTGLRAEAVKTTTV